MTKTLVGGTTFIEIDLDGEEILDELNDEKSRQAVKKARQDYKNGKAINF